MKPRKDLRIFIVDGDPISREIYKQYLLNIGFNNIEFFDNGKECIKELTKIPDIILIDHHMASTDCLENLKNIKRINPDIYLIFISEPGSVEVAINALKYGAFDYIVKGENEMESLQDIMQKILNIMEVLSIKIVQ